MRKERALGMEEEVPEEGYPLAIYVGLILSGLILGIGALVLLRELLVNLTREGLSLTSSFVFRALLFLLSIFSSAACFFGLFWLAKLQKMQFRKVGGEFEDFVMYARPLVEEVIRQRLVGERLLEKLERMEGSRALQEERSGRQRVMVPMSVVGGGGAEGRLSRWGEFLLFVALLANISIGLFIYLDQHPWQLVPYSILVLAMAWWVTMARYFGLLLDVKSYYIPAIFILLTPTLSVLLRGVMEPHEALYTVYVLLFLYIVAMYFYYKYIVTGEVPQFIVRGPGMLLDFMATKREMAVSPRLQEYLPPPKPKPLEAEVPRAEKARFLKRVQLFLAARKRS